MKILYLDCFSGISGDMTLGALLDAGLPLEALREAFGSLAIEGVHVHAERVLRAGVSATKFTVHAHEHHEHQHEHQHGRQNHHAAPSTKHPAPSTKHPALSTLTSTAACRRSSG